MNRWGRNWRWSPNLLSWTVLCIAVACIALLYLSLGLLASDGPLLMPLDDTYIHFQYARQMAQAEPYVYNPGDDPTSGATSFLYTPLLAIGYFIGFHDLSLAYWAVGFGALLFLLSAWLIYRLVLSIFPPENHQRSHYFTALFLSLAFVMNGAFAWAAFSGMETLLFVFTVLLALCTYILGDFRYASLAGGLAALARPEGAVVAGLLGLALLWRIFRQRLWSWWVSLPFLAILIQPTVNFVVTGSFSASGNQAKSHLYNVTIPLSQRLDTVWDFWWRLWREMFTGRSEVDGRYIPAMVVVIALIGMVWSVRDSWRRREISSTLLAASWLIPMSIMISTLDTAFWHFKRYQLPMMALMFPLAGWVLLRLWHWKQWGRMAGLVLSATILVVSSWTTLEYARRYRDNINVLRHQQIPMAEWVDEHLPPDARIGVHDVGVIRYVGNRATYDLVGLTTDGAALAWRQGSGTIVDTMASSENRPDYFAIYHDIQSLPLIAESGVFGEELVRFETLLPRNTVVSATSTQIVSRADWESVDDLEFQVPRQPVTLDYLDDFELLGRLNVGDLQSEDEWYYEWWNETADGGFVSTIRNLSYASCADLPCRGVDGERTINGGERFDLPPLSNNDGMSDYLVVLRLHAATPARLMVGCDEIEGTKVVPFRPGEWVEIPFLVAGDSDQFCIEVDGTYHPASYWVYGGRFSIESPTLTPIATFYEPDDRQEIQLVGVEYAVDEEIVRVNLRWFSEGNLTQDGKFFVHLYDDPNQHPIRQADDNWLGGGILPPANWLPGLREDQIIVPLNDIPAGDYVLAIGFYDLLSENRYTVINSEDDEENNRLFLGELNLR